MLKLVVIFQLTNHALSRYSKSNVVKSKSLNLRMSEYKKLISNHKFDQTSGSH